ncbi:hypothetical protein BAUCODRAFT_103438 [Baudoinia panamericana UAMH 10762]|uniref:Carboxylesterase type B domain-containing protein n=1 Tax=Baudoinia panamericana (strain UAMH 10762) TaxID=717646 RepID=M2LW45_BAUPA|nr:uncharacterized protein BAUCODRAFT_103438 [Baudoinia panamericana UAMH 10762]EMC98882.1 hypothetical protein BAUCODRAFT_103438 [Baudoinia panamericana UAMH 10762]
MLFSFLTLVAAATAAPSAYNSQPYSSVAKRQSSASSSLQVDLGYSVYQGHTNSTANLNVFQGIRFAAAPIGNLRFQAPRAPTTNRSATISANSYAPQCPQSPSSHPPPVTPVNQTGSSEDCLFLNVWSPSNGTNLPVLVWIHGGGYGQGNGRQDLTAIINTNGNSFVGVSIQYRLGAFGFLSSDEVFRKGAVNAGLLDQHLALQWVQEYIHLFNGDPTRVTIAGESAGGGSVMLQDMAYGGSLGTQLFINTIAASPYLPMQYGYKDWVPSQSYYAFATAAGCPPSMPYLPTNGTPIFECLVSKNTSTLMNASATVSQEGSYGTWAFLPVTDGVFVQDLPSRQLGRGQVNGLNILSGNNANEGYYFTPQNIKTEDQLVQYLRVTFPLLSNNDIAKILYYYPSTNASVDPNTPFFATSGNMGATALNESSDGTGQQQRADNIYAETTFVCPSYWLAEAYSNNRNGGQGYKLQFSIPPSEHGGDVAGYFDYPGQYYSVDFTTAFQRIWGNFITTSNPAISNAVANGVSTNNVSINAASSFPPYSIYSPNQLDLNTTCPIITTLGGIEYCNSSTAVNQFSLVNAYTWEGGRGTRCDFWRALGELVPE